MIKNYGFALVFLGLTIVFYLTPDPDVSGFSPLLLLRLVSCALLVAFGVWALVKVIQLRLSAVLLGVTGLISLAIGLAGFLFSVNTYLVG